MLQVRAEPADSMIKKFRRNTCNGDQRQFGGTQHAIRKYNSLSK